MIIDWGLPPRSAPPQYMNYLSNVWLGYAKATVLAVAPAGVFVEAAKGRTFVEPSGDRIFSEMARNRMFVEGYRSPS